MLYHQPATWTHGLNCCFKNTVSLFQFYQSVFLIKMFNIKIVNICKAAMDEVLKVALEYMPEPLALAPPAAIEASLEPKGELAPGAEDLRH